MATFMANASNIERKWYIVDAADKPMGRVATEVAKLLRGKIKATYTPHVDCGDFVIVINAEKSILTGNKLDQKMYRHHTGWVGGLKEVKYSTLMQKNPEFAFELAVKGMIPNNVIGRSALRRLRIYKGEEHNHQAQKPEIYNID
ncbi:MAG: 50S ribosomal protein L13 [Clostridiales bacterium]|nr:MAG: 50S ribosomal protein L13 [Clostridiales bacterium]